MGSSWRRKWQPTPVLLPGISMDGGAWWPTVHRVAKSRTWLSNFTFTFTMGSGGHVWMWELDHKESWAPKNWCFWIMVLDKTLESPLDFKEIKLVSPKGSQSWKFVGRTDAEAETPTLWLPDEKNWLIRKDPDAGKAWRQEKKGMTEDEMLGWHHWLDGHEFEQAPGVADGQEAWHAAVHGVRKSWTWLSDWTELNWWGPQRVRHNWVVNTHN